MGAKPGREGFGSSVGQQVYRTMALPVNEQCPIGKTATKREVIDAKNRRYRKRLCHLGLGKPQERIRAHLRASCFEQPCSGLSSTLNGKDVQEKRQSIGSPSNGSNEIRQRFSECLFRAPCAQTAKSSHAKP
jgi:hypothetical protein